MLLGLDQSLATVGCTVFVRVRVCMCACVRVCVRVRVAPACHHEDPGRDLSRLLVRQLVVERAHRVAQLTPQAALTDSV